MNSITADTGTSKLLGFEIGDNMRKFLNWALVWLILSNACFMTLWAVGAPPRKPEILAAGVVGLIVRGRPLWLQYTAFCAVIIYSTLGFIAGLFNLSILSLLHSIQFFMEINPSNSVEYILAGGAMLLTLVAAFFALRRDTDFTGAKWLLVSIALIFGLAKVDNLMGKGMRGHYKRAPVEGAFFESAATKSDFFARADGHRNLVMVIVESLGAPHDNAEISRKLFALYNDPKVTDLYDIETGTNLYYYSTTSGEVRELCGRWGDYYDLLETKDDSCQPAALGRKGYVTKAMHSFDGNFFERKTWYPNIGFQESQFAKDILARGTGKCGGVFPGVCDRDVPKLITEELKKTDKPQFIYWLTVNTHLPVPPGSNLEVENCEKVSPTLARDFPMICRQFAIFDAVDRALVSEITAEDFPESDILIVGDHMPPYFDRHHRSQFDPEHVPFIHLKRKSAGGKNAPVQVAAHTAAK